MHPVTLQPSSPHAVCVAALLLLWVGPEPCGVEGQPNYFVLLCFCASTPPRLWSSASSMLTGMRHQQPQHDVLTSHMPGQAVVCVVVV